MDMELKRKIAEDAISLIVSDIESRRGIGDEWESIDAATQLEIRKEWCGIVARGISMAIRANGDK